LVLKSLGILGSVTWGMLEIYLGTLWLYIPEVSGGNKTNLGTLVHSR